MSDITTATAKVPRGFIPDPATVTTAGAKATLMSTASIHAAKVSRGFVPEPAMVTINGAKVFTGLGETTIRNFINDGTLRHAKIGGRRLIYMDSLKQLIGAGD